MRRALVLAVLTMTLFAVATRSRAQDAEPSPDRGGATDPAASDDHAESTGETAETRARDLFVRGIALAQEERWSEALPLFAASRELVARASTVYNVAVCLQRLGRLVEAISAFHEFLDIADPEHDADKIAEARSALVVARGSLGEIALALTPADADVLVDGALVPGAGSPRVVPMDPGERHVIVRARGHHDSTFSMMVTSGGRDVRTVTLEALPEPVVEVRERIVRVDRPVDPQPWVLFGGGALVGVVGAILIAIAETDALAVENAPDGSTWAGIRESYERASALRIAGPILLGAGLATAALGVVWHVVLDGAHSAQDERDRLALEVGLGGVSLRGSLP